PYWSEAVKRQRIRQAIPTHRRRGTAAAVRATVESFGAGVALREWWQTEPPGTPHTFTLLLTVRDATHAERLQADIVREVERVKPARSHFTLVAGLTASGGLGAKAVARPVVARRLAFIATHEDAA
uniref:phage tail protein I n=1 Tax=Vibrio splendidus TaxID=29497 RepID=UPI0009BDC712